MKYIDEYRDGTVARALSNKIRALSTRKIRLMEICGTHTMAIFRHGIRTLLPDTVELVSGPGCPVCVTAMEEIDRAVKLARFPGAIVTTFGDMLRVPGSESSLQYEQAQGADVRMVYSTFDALTCATQNPDHHVVFLGIGFETTAPTVAAAIKTAHEGGYSNFSVLSAHKLLPPAMDALLSGGDLNVDGFICPGHVTTIIGTSSYEKVVKEYHTPCVVVGFEPVDILQGILMLVEQIEGGRAQVEIQYTRGVNPEGNTGALQMLDQIFTPCDSPWRGLGRIPESGLAIREKYSAIDAGKRFNLEVPPAREPAGCLCAEILRGAVRPPDCRLFRRACTPQTPVGPCMVSSEGTCAAYFKYHEG
ncbi:MAG: hydrogenase formation protein HypD [Deltaproteobacteria bacterium]|nr:hydrogenase formation protein HypD [Deltaproteobacteria bacterium]MBW2048559.1 hydrogenase formation protein HypD [Deltaproteobacteria bacterium]MBW2110532.1 hydrogenase formation protein HypD [Deltaproteobacteria bacterium]MBW2352164.1 hydrogenase formation protein HypD [Deltaproteobacteria bacterium]HDZ90958.1 hydrogenase formation protein HypD [Deltaproteobacteria bacterium]